MIEGNPGRVCLGMTLYNKARYLDAAVSSLLDQTHPDFNLIAVDDASSDDTEAIMRRWAAKDSRVHYFRNSTWKGMIETWRIAFFKSMELYNPSFFAWASDHDVWQPDWLQRHLEAMAACPDASLVYPETIPIGPDGEVISRPPLPPFDTYDEDELGHLYNVSSRLGVAGYAVYGLFRAEHLLKAGVFRRVMLPDRLLLTEISAFGRIKQINEKLWCRRFFGADMSNEDTLKRQQVTLFGPGGPPPQSEFPFLSHVLILLHSLSISPKDQDRSRMAKGLALSGLVWERRRHRIRRELERLHTALRDRNSSGPDGDREVTCNNQTFFDLAASLGRELCAQDDMPAMKAALMTIRPEIVDQTLLWLRLAEAEQVIKRLEQTVESLKQERRSLSMRLLKEKQIKQAYKKEAELSIRQRLAREIRTRLGRA